MAQSESPRKAALSIKYKGTALDAKIQEQATSFSYTDVASGASDSLSITLQNMEKKWLNEWLPSKGDSITANIILKNWEKAGDKKTFKCGTFTIDDLSFSGRPLSAGIGAVSAPASAGFKVTRKSKTWEDVTIKEIASKIAEAAGLKLYYSAANIKISEVEQSSETDSSFLYGLCEKYGLAMKVYSNKLVIFDEVAYEKKAKVATINETDMLSWSYNTTIDGTYTGVRLKYTNPTNKKTTSVTVGTTERLYEYSAQVDSKYDAELQAAAKLRNENKKADTMEVKILANPVIVASSVVEIRGLGKLNGLYYVDKVKHTVGTGYTMSLSLHRFKATAADSAEKAAAGVSGKDQMYVVQKGDTLWALAYRFYGSGMKHSIIYEANKEVIDAEEAARGMANDGTGAGHWIFPGTKLIIPAIE